MESKTFEVPNISCNHCVHAVESELKGIAGVQSVAASAETRLVSVTWEAPADWGAIVAALTEIEYPPASA
jgi:copper chaperone